MEFYIHYSFFITLICVSVIAEVPSSTDSYLTVADRTRLKKVIESGFNFQDISAVHHAVLGYTLLEETVPRSAEICKYLLQSAGDGNSLTPEIAYYITSTWKTLKVCKALPANSIAKALNTVLERESSTIPELYYAIHSIKSLSQAIADAATSKIVKAIQAAFKKDDGLRNLGYTFHIAADLGSSGAFVFDKIEDIIVQADEIDGRFLQFEGGLTVTSLLVNGIYKLSSTLKKRPPLTSQQMVKLTNYFLSRRSVQTPRGVVALLSSLDTLANNDFESPVCIALVEGENAVSAEEPLVRIRVCDVRGKPLPTIPSVIANSVKRVDDDIILMTKKSFLPSADKTLFTMNLMDAKPERGFYQLSVSAGLHSNIISIKVLSEAVVDYLEVGIVDADQTTQPKLVKVSHPEKLKTSIEADFQQKLVIRFLLKDSLSKKTIRVHQAFVKLSPLDASGEKPQETILIAEPDASHTYKLDMPIGTSSKYFGYQSGDYNMELIIGDAILSNSFQWEVATVRLKFPESKSVETAKKFQALKNEQDMYHSKPEIRHMFREPEKRPPAFVSNLFTGLCLAPVLILLILWAGVGVNVSNFSFSVSAIAFHVGLGGIFILFGIFWLKLNMFVTLRYLLGLGIVTFLAGNKLLSQMAHTHKKCR